MTDKNNPIEIMIKGFIHYFNKISRFFDPFVPAIRSLLQIAYSDRYCQKFKCVNCSFMRPLNYVLGEKYFSIGERTIIGKYSSLTAWDNYQGEKFTPKVSIGENCNLGEYLHLTCIDEVVIGSGVLTGRWVTITDNAHGSSEEISEGTVPHDRKLYSKGPVIIEDNVWIGDKATILPGITIGKNSIVGANSVVTKSVPPNSVVAGNPAKVICTCHRKE